VAEQPVHQKYVHKYIRYTTRDRNGSSLEKTGLFASAYKLRDSNSLPSSEQQELLECLLWFQRHVRTARIDELSDLEQQAVCWYKNPDHPFHNHPTHDHSNYPALDNAFAAKEASAYNKETSPYNDASAQEALIQTKTLVVIMQRHGFLVQAERANEPGVILSEDDVQVAAIPARNIWHALRLRLLLWRQRNIPKFC
jgi:hypothetical protein